ncbi:hypothetical protein TNCV_447061 [Trichonephila clavipes]|nr:hypothetical protein TNCV_447061 [Trichonephila clavipes]
MTRRRVENRVGSFGYPGFVEPMFAKDSKPLGKRKRSLGTSGLRHPYSPKEGEPPEGCNSSGVKPEIIGGRSKDLLCFLIKAGSALGPSMALC